MKKTCILTCLLLFTGIASAQTLFFAKANYTDSAAFEKNIPDLARQVIVTYSDAKKGHYYYALMVLQIIARDYNKVPHLSNLAAFYSFADSSYKSDNMPYKMYSAAIVGMQGNDSSFAAVYRARFTTAYNAYNLNDELGALQSFHVDMPALKKAYDNMIKKVNGSDSISVHDAVTLSVAWGRYKIFSATLQMAKGLLVQIDQQKYIKNDSVLVKMPDGGTISLVIVRDRKVTTPQPVVLMYNIYARVENDFYYCKSAVSKGYIGIVANTRGKRLSADAIEPFEHDAKDAYYIIDWISKQPWCNGKVGMYGGSYLGFSQWSAVKYPHPALKTIVPQVAVGAGIDFPVFNGVYLFDEVRWLPLVMNSKFTDDAGLRDTARWNKLAHTWYKAGNSYRSLDTLNGKPNAIFQRWLNHPAYDSYWQTMTPQKKEFANITIPILTITGYWDDDQTGAMYYYRQYQKYNKLPNQYLLIGPYDHSGAQDTPATDLAGYKIDKVANISIDSLVFQWFDYVMKDGKRPTILQDKVNFEVMGENKWRHVATLDQMHNDTLTLYLGNTLTGKQYPLLAEKPQKRGYIQQTVDMADRSKIYTKGDDIYAFDHLIDSVLNPEKEKLIFISQPVEKPYAISGAIAANILASINKKDVDLVLDLYEQTPDGKYLALSEVVQRASLAKDRTKRQLLHPGKIENIGIKNTYITSKLLQKGSRIVVLIGVNKSIHWQINYGTGGDVSDETIKDAAIPMDIKWYNGSCIKLPVLR